MLAAGKRLFKRISICRICIFHNCISVTEDSEIHAIWNNWYPHCAVYAWKFLTGRTCTWRAIPVMFPFVLPDPGGVQWATQTNESGAVWRCPGAPHPRPSCDPHGPGPRPAGRGGGQWSAECVPTGSLHRRVWGVWDHTEPRVRGGGVQGGPQAALPQAGPW